MKYRLPVYLLLGLVASSCANEATGPRRAQAGRGAPQSAAEVTGPSNDPSEERTTTKRSQRTEEPSPTSTKPVFLAAMSGWNSCSPVEDGAPADPRGMNIYPHLEELHRNLSKNIDMTPDFFASCMTEGRDQHRFYESSSGSNLQTSAAEGVMTAIGEATKQRRARLLLVGHSYGGFYAMRMVQKKASGLDLLGFVTIDPISPLGCAAATIAKILLSRLSFDGSEREQGCLRPPGGEDGLAVDTIASKTPAWLNLWQTDFVKVLHSGPIQAAKNLRLSHKDVEDAINGHITVGKNPNTWRQIGDWIKSLDQ